MYDQIYVTMASLQSDRTYCASCMKTDMKDLFREIIEQASFRGARTKSRAIANNIRSF